MSETIEERAERICHRLDLEPAYSAGGPEAIALIKDLMAERSTGIPLDLDTLFPKEVMEETKSVRSVLINDRCGPVSWGKTPKESVLKLLVDEDVDIREVFVGKILELGAYDKFPGQRNNMELACVRIRLGLRVERVE